MEKGRGKQVLKILHVNIFIQTFLTNFTVYTITGTQNHMKYIII